MSPTEDLNQKEFERRLTDLENLIQADQHCIINTSGLLEQGVLGTIEKLYELSTFVSESSTLNDIEGLLGLRSSLCHFDFCSGMGENGVRETHIDTLLRYKISRLTERDHQKIDLEPMQALLRLKAISRKVNRAKIYGSQRNEVDQILAWRTELWIKSMVSPEVTPMHIIPVGPVRKAKQPEDKSTQADIQTTDKAKHQNYYHDLGALTEQVAELKAQKSQLEVKLKAANATLESIGKLVSNRTIVEDAPSVQNSVDDFSEDGGLTPTSTAPYA